MANIYVRKSGSDSNDGLTPATAKLTISSAITAASSNDSIYIGAGIYREPQADISSKNLYIYGDPTGSIIGDCGDVIWTGMNETDTDYNAIGGGGALAQSVGSSTSIGITVKNIIFQKFKSTIISHNGPGRLDIQDCSFFDSKGTAIKFSSAYTSDFVSITLKNIYVDGLFASRGISISDSSNQGTHNINNIKIRNIFYGKGTGAETCYGFYHSRYNYYDANYYNIDVSNIIAQGCEGMRAVGIYSDNHQYGKQYFNSCRVDNIISTATNGIAYGYMGETYRPIQARNCSAGVVNATTAEKYAKKDDVYPWAVKTDSLDISSYDKFKIPKISKHSPLRGQGYTTFPTTDIEGNPRPAYGNGTACDIGASEATSDTIQKESTIKDSGDYSIKVSPCNYFKKVFQVPVEATKLRTVKVKIRIDGTWGTYLPRVSLSGQGMTLSTATKNATTGSFEELTVSGTPTTTGIALLTIEAHSPNTDAAFYIDTITIE